MSTSLRCRPGDLAVIVGAKFQANLGQIVRVIRADDKRTDIRFPRSMPTWWVESPRPLVWVYEHKRYRRKRGPVPDAYLQPIRKPPTLRDIAEDICNLEISRNAHLSECKPESPLERCPS